LERIIRLQQNKSEDPEIVSKCEKAKGILSRHEASLTQYKVGLKKPDWLKGGEVIDYSDLELGDKLGGGGFGDVHVAIWKKKLQVAVKKLRVQRVSQSKKEQFEKEVRLFSSLNHPAIVEFYGVCPVSPNLAIVMEFMPKGSLHDVLHVEEWKLTKKQKSQMIGDILSAISYIHNVEQVAHRDIKSMNVLVSLPLML
jgi:serine/threonine protein kinase